MALIILRGIFLISAIGIGTTVLASPALEEASGSVGWGSFVGIMIAAVTVVGMDIAFPRKRIEIVSCVYFGVLVGLFLTYVTGQAVRPLLVDDELRPNDFFYLSQVVMGVFFSYVCISMLLQTKDDFRFIIPYVEFAKEVKGSKPCVLDTSVVIDGRIADVVETHIFDTQLILPRFALAELQAIADSGDKLRRARGRRGLDILNQLRSNKLVDLKIYDREFPDMDGQPVDMKLVLLCKHLDGKIVTGDYNLNKVARLHNVPVINLNDIANTLKPVFLPGERMEVQVVKAGEEPGQGVGYLDDGTMIVIENGRDHIGESIQLVVTSVLQTSAGRMIFGRYDSGE